MLLKWFVFGSTWLVLCAVIWFWNHEFFLIINHNRSDMADQWIGLIGGVGDGLIVAVLMCLLMLSNMRAGVAGMMAFLLSGVLAQLLKRLVEAPRPPVVLDHVYVLGDSLSRHSFPSGHAASLGAMAITFMLFFGWKTWQSWLAVTLCAVAAYGRMYVGVHFPIDVWVGLSLGVVSAWLCWSYVHQQAKKTWQSSVNVWYSVAFLLLILLVVLVFNYRVQPQTAQALQWWVSLFSVVSLFILWKKRFEN